MTDDAVPVFADATPRIRRVSVDRPWTWLAAGWRDVLAAPGVSLAYGALMVALTYLLLLVLVQVGVFWLVLPLSAGFFFTVLAAFLVVFLTVFLGAELIGFLLRGRPAARRAGPAVAYRRAQDRARR